MKHNKQHYINIGKRIGWEWGGYLPDEKLHFFCKGNYKDGFPECKVNEQDLVNGNLEYMTANKLTRA